MLQNKAVSVLNFSPSQFRIKAYLFFVFFGHLKTCLYNSKLRLGEKLIILFSFSCLFVLVSLRPTIKSSAYSHIYIFSATLDFLCTTTTPVLALYHIFPLGPQRHRARVLLIFSLLLQQPSQSKHYCNARLLLTDRHHNFSQQQGAAMM